MGSMDFLSPGSVARSSYSTANSQRGHEKIIANT
jgi:hypothetical protein